MSTPGDVCGSRLPTHLTVANTKADEYGFKSGHAESGSPPAVGPCDAVPRNDQLADQTRAFEDEDDDDDEDDYETASTLTKYHSRRVTVVEPLWSGCRCRSGGAHSPYLGHLLLRLTCNVRRAVVLPAVSRRCGYDDWQHSGLRPRARSADRCTAVTWQPSEFHIELFQLGNRELLAESRNHIWRRRRRSQPVYR